MTHVDEYIWQCNSYDSDAVKYLKYLLMMRRLPAVNQAAWDNIIENMRPVFCSYKGARYQVIGASRMGDVWLASPKRSTESIRNIQYELRVCVDDLEDISL